MHMPIAPVTSVLAFLATFMFADLAKADPEIGYGTAVDLTTTVDAIDPVNRLVTITGPLGNTVVMRAYPEVQNLNQIQPGDQIKICYYEQTAFALRKHEGPPINKDEAISGAETADMGLNAPTEAVQAWVETAAPGAKPSASAVERVEVTATVKKVDYANRVVTLYGPANTTRVVFVDPSVPGLREIKAGDRVVMLVTEAVAIDVTQ